MSQQPPSFTTGAAQPPSDPLALDRPKNLGELFRDGWLLWRSNTGVFLMTAALVVIPFEVIVIGLLGGGFNDAYGNPALWAQVASPLLVGVFGTALITAIHARAVVALARGEKLTTGEAFALGLKGFGVIALATLVYLLAFVFGLLLILPGVFISIAGVFTAQIAALHGTGPVESIKASVRLVRGSGWWRTFGYLIVLNLVASIGTVAASILIAVASVASGEPSGFGAIAVPLTAVFDAAVMSWTALVTTLVYFSWRAEQGDAFVEGGGAPAGGNRPTPQTGPAVPGGPTFTKG
jgi:hypothetical protein